MPNADLVNLKKEKVGVVDLDEELFASKVNRPLIHEAVVMQQASMRQGTAATKTRGMVRGGGKKPWRQKGTGRARAGSSRSPLWRGGGTVFGPSPRKYGYSFPRKKYRAALRGVLTAKLQDGELLVLEGLQISEGKTKRMVEILKSLEISGRTLIVTTDIDDNLIRASRNIQNVKLLPVHALNVYDLICARHILVPQAALPRLKEVWK